MILMSGANTLPTTSQLVSGNGASYCAGALVARVDRVYSGVFSLSFESVLTVIVKRLL